MNPYFLIFEFGAIFGLLAVFYRERRNPQLREVLALAFVYGLFLEALNIRMSQHIYGYHPDFVLEMLNVPLAIGAGWAIIFYLARNLAGRFSLSWWQSPFLMALIALSYDLAIDAVAIRLGFWSWKIPFDQEWFGVPYDNFFGWLAVVWTFALLVSLSFQDIFRANYRKILRYLSPFLSALLVGLQIMFYVNLSAFLSGRYALREAVALYGAGEYAFAYETEVQVAKGYLLLALVLLLSAATFLWIRKSGPVKTPENLRFASALSLAIHFMFLAFVFVSGMYKTYPVFVFVSLAAYFFTASLERLSASRRRFDSPARTK